MLRQQALQRQKHTQQMMRERAGSVSGQRGAQRQRSGVRHLSEDEASGKSRRKGGRISVSVCPVDSEPSTPKVGKGSNAVSPNASISRSDSLLARRKRKENSLIDDVVMPALTPARFEPLLVKEILTPSWRRSGSRTPSSADSVGFRIEPGESVFSPGLDATQEVPEGVQEEGLDDDVFVARHAPCELMERQRALGIVSETGQRSSVAGGESRGRDHSKGPMVKIIENRDSSVQPNPGYKPRTFPLTGKDLADVRAEIPAPPEVFPQLADLEAAMYAPQTDEPAPSSPTAGAEESKPIKLLFKLRPSSDDA